MSTNTRTETVLARLGETQVRREKLYRRSSASSPTATDRASSCAPTWTPCRSRRTPGSTTPARRPPPTRTAGEVPVAHACGHDVHVTCLLEAADLLAGAKGAWSGTVVALFQPSEELGDGAQTMVDDGLADVVGPVDVAMGQHVLAFPSGTVGTRAGSMLSAADSIRITVHGRGSHGSMPQTAIDPVVLASMIVLRLQTIVSREIGPTEPAVVTVGSIHAGTKSNVIGDQAVLEVNTRTYSEETRRRVLDAIQRMVVAECQASQSPKDPEFELYDGFPTTVNDEETTATVRAAFDEHFGDDATDLPLQSASEDFSDIPDALGVPANHSPAFAPVIQPTLDTGTRALVVAALAHLS